MLGYARAAGDWGKSEIPEVFTVETHPRGIAAKDFLWNKCSINIQRQILQDDIKNAAQLWTYLKTEVTVAAHRNSSSNMNYR